MIRMSDLAKILYWIHTNVVCYMTLPQSCKPGPGIRSMACGTPIAGIYTFKGKSTFPFLKVHS